VLALAVTCAAGAAKAQASADIEIETDARYRGVSLSAGEPAVSVNVSYDRASGFYGGLSGTAGDFEGADARALSYVAYVGYAARMDAQTAWDVGLTNNGSIIRLDRRYAENYTEFYAGVSRGDISVHLYYSPKYAVEDAAAVYLEVDAATHPAPGWRLFGHAGALAPLRPTVQSYVGGARFDLRVGVAREFRHVEINAAWTVVTPSAVYPEGYRQSPTALEAALVYFF
jgi:uncharacterized protein (TIGR02001 family)